MKITSFHIQRFGIWEDLRLPKISGGLNLFYGPNEAGKTTLMQFVRSSLYGCGDGERARYIQMATGVETASNWRERLTSDRAPETADSVSQNSPNHWIGGELALQTELGSYRVARRYLRRDSSFYDRQSALEAKSGFIVSGGLAAWSGRFYPIQGTGVAESLIVSGPDGARLSDYFIRTLVNNVDEATFNNVFAIGLDELQKLGALDQTDAAAMLYRLSVGMDRVSLIQVLHQMVDERNEALDFRGKPAILDGLLAYRSRAAAKSLEPAALLRDYTRTLTSRTELEEQVAQLEEKIERQTRRKNLYEIARRIAPDWNVRGALRQEISDVGSVLAVGDEALNEANRLNGLIRGTDVELSALKSRYLETKKAICAIVWNEEVRKNAARIELLREEIPRLNALAADAQEKQETIDRIEEELHREETRLRGVKQGKTLLSRNLIDSLSDRSADSGERTNDAADTNADHYDGEREVEDYRIGARGLMRCRKRLAQIREQYAEVSERLRVLTEKLDQELSSRGQKSLNEALETTGEQVTQLRRRVEIGRRLSEFETSRKELIRQNARLTSSQTLPAPMLLLLGTVVAVGGLVATLAFLGQGNVDYGLGVLGLLGAAAAVFYKTTTEKKNYSLLEENQRQYSALTRKFDQIREEAAAIDARSPAAGQTVEIRLQKAQDDMAHFERLVPLDAKWKETTHHGKTLENRLERATEALRDAERRWKSWLQNAGLSADLSPSDVKAMLERVDVADALRRRLDIQKNEMDLILRERRGIVERLNKTQKVVGVAETGEKSPVKLIERLGDMLREVRAAREEKAAQTRKLAEFRRQRKVLAARRRAQNSELVAFLSLFEVPTLERLEELAVRYRNHLDRLARLEALDGRIAAACGESCTGEELDAVLTDESARENLEALEKQTRDLVAVLSSERTQKTLAVGRLTEQLQTLAERKEGIRWQFEKSAADRRIDEMAALWRSRAVACKMMEDIRKAYEKERQPETLQEASRLLHRLTEGHYVKIWTPLGEDTLFVDTNDGKTLDVGDLSRGTREQLFIAIRLALAGSFEKHGIRLPLILDDVLVNFDNRRAECAAEMLLEFAAAGRQIFLFTCHEHICRTFLRHNTPVFILPDKSQVRKQFRVLLPETSHVEPKTVTPIPESVPTPIPEPTPEPVTQERPVEPIEISAEPVIVVDSPTPNAGERVFADPSAPIEKPRILAEEIVLKPAAETPAVPEPIQAEEPAPEPIQAEEPAPEPIQAEEPAPERHEHGLLDLFLETAPDETLGGRAGTEPVEFTRWDDYFGRETATSETATSEADETPLVAENDFVRDFFVRDLSERRVGNSDEEPKE